MSSTVDAPPPLVRFTKDTLVNGKAASVECVRVNGQTFVVERGALTVVRCEDEWFDDVADPASVVEQLRHGRIGADLFTFWQRLPQGESGLPYPTEQVGWAVMPVTTHAQWWNHQIKSRLRSQIRKSQKDGLVVRATPFDDDFVRGMTAIFNESPVRQGRSFWHYGKDFDTVKAQFSRFIHRETMIGAYFEDRLVGFMMLGHAGHFCLANQILASLHHRDLQPTAALVSKAVEICAERGVPNFAYGFWTEDSLSEFKRRCGFQKVEVPLHHVALSWKGELALRTGAHKGWKHFVPAPVVDRLKGWRRHWNERRAGLTKAADAAG